MPPGNLPHDEGPAILKSARKDGIPAELLKLMNEENLDPFLAHLITFTTRARFLNADWNPFHNTTKKE